MRRLVMAILPSKWFYANHLTASARRLLLRVAIGSVALLVFTFAIGLLDKANWSEVLAGAGFAWSTALLVWATNSYRKGQDDTRQDLRRVAELDLLHHRLNQAAPHLDIPVLDLSSEIEVALRARMERLAHFAGLDEFRGEATEEGYAFWSR